MLYFKKERMIGTVMILLIAKFLVICAKTVAGIEQNRIGALNREQERFKALVSVGIHHIFEYDIQKDTLMTSKSSHGQYGNEQYYHDFGKLYDKVIARTPIFVAPDVLDKKQTLEQFKTHPLSYIKFLGYMNKSMKEVLREYFKGEQILQFFDKLTSTYCYATVEEAPAVLGAVMFLDNHVGGSYYPVGSTMQLIGKLEKLCRVFIYSER